MFQLNRYTNQRRLHHDLGIYFKELFSFADNIVVTERPKGFISHINVLLDGNYFSIYIDKMAFHLLRQINTGQVLYYPACGKNFTPFFEFPSCETLIYQDNAPELTPIMKRPRREYFSILRLLSRHGMVENLRFKTIKNGKTEFNFKLRNPIDDNFYAKTLLFYDRPLGNIYTNTPNELNTTTLFYTNFFINFFVDVENASKADVRLSEHIKVVDFLWKVFSQTQIGTVYDFCIPAYLIRSMGFTKIRKKFNKIGLTQIVEPHQIYRKVSQITQEDFNRVMYNVGK